MVRATNIPSLAHETRHTYHQNDNYNYNNNDNNQNDNDNTYVVDFSPT